MEEPATTGWQAHWLYWGPRGPGIETAGGSGVKAGWQAWRGGGGGGGK